MRVVDFHSHFFSRPFFDALAAQSPLPGTAAEKLAAVVERTGIELPPDDVGEHLARWIADLDACGVDHMVTFASVPEEAPAVAEAVARAGGRLSGMVVVNPRVDGAAAAVARLVGERGLRGVLTFPAMHHFDPGGEEARPVLEVLAEHRAVCYVHCGLLVVKLRDLLGLPRRYDLTYANPLGVIPAASAFPDVHFVIPHFGAGFFREALLAGAQCPNVHVDTSSTNSWIRTQPGVTSLRDVFARALDVFGPERVLFGTDSNVFPAGWRKERLEEQRAILDELGASESDQQRVLAGNATRLLGLDRNAPGADR